MSDIVLPEDVRLKYLLRRLEEVRVIRETWKVSPDWDLVKKIGHQIRGNGPTFGFPRLGMIGETLEKLATQKDPEGLKVLLQAYEGHVSELKQNIELLISDQNKG